MNVDVIVEHKDASALIKVGSTIESSNFDRKNYFNHWSSRILGCQGFLSSIRRKIGLCYILQRMQLF